jgi:hypothetical protein
MVVEFIVLLGVKYCKTVVVINLWNNCIRQSIEILLERWGLVVEFMFVIMLCWSKVGSCRNEEEKKIVER